MKLRGIFSGLFLAGWLASAWGGEPDLLQARDLIRQGKPLEVLPMLQPAKADSSAEHYYFLGLALLDSGDPENAISAFLEALRRQPGLLQAEAELGRAYLLTGNYLAAQFAFDRVKAGSPPPEVLTAIAGYVEQLHRQLQSQRPRFRASLSLGLGHDSNVNSATSAQSVLLPILGGITATLDSDARAQSDSFKNVTVEGSGFVPLDDQTELFAGGSLVLKDNQHVDAFDYLTGTVNAGVRYAYGPQQQSQVSLSVLLDTLRQDHDRVRDSYGLSAEYRRIVHPLAEVSAYVQSSKLDYIQDDFRDAQRDVIGVAVNPVAFGKRLFNLPPILALYGGRERPDDTGVDHLANDFYGARTTAVYLFNSRTALVGGIAYEHRKYGAPDPLFGETRVDRQTDVTLALNYALSRDWALTPVISYTDSRSTLDVFAFTRTAATLTARYQF